MRRLTVCTVPVRFRIREPTGSLVRSAGILPFQLPCTSEETKPPGFQYVEAPEPILTETSAYPFELAQRGLEDETKVEFMARSNGFVTQTRIIQVTDPDFGESTAAMLRA